MSKSAFYEKQRTGKTSQRNSSKKISQALRLLCFRVKWWWGHLRWFWMLRLDCFRTIVGKVDHHGAIPNHKPNTAWRIARNYKLHGGHMWRCCIKKDVVWARRKKRRMYKYFFEFLTRFLIDAKNIESEKWLLLFTKTAKNANKRLQFAAIF